jgi:hypothetical protein
MSMRRSSIVYVMGGGIRSMVGGGVGRGLVGPSSGWVGRLSVLEVMALRDDRLAKLSGMLMVRVGSLGAMREAQSVTRLLVVWQSYPDML